MKKKTLGIVGHRGLVGQVLHQRLLEENNYHFFNLCFYSTSLHGNHGPIIDGHQYTYHDANNIKDLEKMDIILSTQGSDFTESVYKQLKDLNWNGHWIDGASFLRMEEESHLVAGPLNQSFIQEKISEGHKLFVGSNCTVTLLLFAIDGLIKNDLVQWVSTMTYQAASGAGAQGIDELLTQTVSFGEFIKSNWSASESLLELEKNVSEYQQKQFGQTEAFSAPLSLGLIPWIDAPRENGQTKEEWKAQAEANKILNNKDSIIPIDGTCVRVSTLRCHGQALTIKLKKDLPLEEIEEMIKTSHPWCQFVENTAQKTAEGLHPASISGTLNVAVGRIRKLSLGPDYINLFTMGDQLLWGAAEPLRWVLLDIIGEKTY
jgi:aspartate-semialdehyde dehydrogenase